MAIERWRPRWGITPSNVDANKIEANFDDGVLEVDLPKMPEVKPKKITVSAKKKEKSGK